MSRNVEAFDAWIRSTFVELNTTLENLYFERENRASVDGVGDELKRQILDEGRTFVRALAEEGNTDEGFDQAFDVLGDLGLYMRGSDSTPRLSGSPDGRRRPALRGPGAACFPLQVHAVHVERNGRVVVVWASGELDAFVVTDLETAFTEVAEGRRIVVDLERVSFMFVLHGCNRDRGRVDRAGDLVDHDARDVCRRQRVREQCRHSLEPFGAKPRTPFALVQLGTLERTAALGDHREQPLSLLVPELARLPEREV